MGFLWTAVFVIAVLIAVGIALSKFILRYKKVVRNIPEKLINISETVDSTIKEVKEENAKRRREEAENARRAKRPKPVIGGGDKEHKTPVNSETGTDSSEGSGDIPTESFDNLGKLDEFTRCAEQGLSFRYQEPESGEE